MTDLKKPISRRALAALGPAFGCDRKRRLVVTLLPGNGRDVEDLIELRPEGTRRAERITAQDVYRYAIQCRVNRGNLEKARAVKARKAARAQEVRFARLIRVEAR